MSIWFGLFGVPPPPKEPDDDDDDDTDAAKVAAHPRILFDAKTTSAPTPLFVQGEEKSPKARFECVCVCGIKKRVKKWGKKRCIFSMDKMRSPSSSYLLHSFIHSFIHSSFVARFAFVGRTPPPREKKKDDDDHDDGVSSSIAAAALRDFPLFRRRRKRFFEEARV